MVRTFVGRTVASSAALHRSRGTWRSCHLGPGVHALVLVADAHADGPLLVTFVLATSVWFGFALTFHQQVLSLFVAFHLLVLVSACAVSHTSIGPVRGRLVEPVCSKNQNLLGPVATFGIIAAYGLRIWSSSVVVRLVSSACIAADILVAIKATSATDWIALVIGAASFGLVQLSDLLRSRGVSMVRLRVAIITGAELVGTVIVARSSRFLASLVGRETSFSARRDVWEFVVDVVRQRPLTGYGFATFWDDPDNIAKQYNQIGILSWFAHSTFIEALLYLGLIGLALLIVVVLSSLGRVCWVALGSSSIAMAWWVATAMFALAENLVESMIAFHSIFWVLLVAPGFAALRSTIDNVTRPRRTLNTPGRSADPSG